MKQPLVLVLLLPIFYLSIIISNKYCLGVFAVITIFLMLLEIKLRYGNISRKSIGIYFNTPIKKLYFDGEEVIDNSPKVSILKGVIIILGGAVIVAILLLLYFAFFQ